MTENTANPFKPAASDNDYDHSYSASADNANPFAVPAENEQSKTLLETISTIESKDTNYIFLYGKRTVGKSYITASLIYYLKTCRLGDLYLSPTTSRESELLYEDMYMKFQAGKLLDRTNVLVAPYEIDLVFRPKDRSLPEMRITFLEMSGENLEKVQISRNDPQSGRLPENIDIFFLCRNIKLIFFLVADHANAASESMAIDKFLQYVFNKDQANHTANYLLAITKWDTYTGKHKKIEDFTRDVMPNIHNRLINEHVGNAITHYSIGRILHKMDNGVDTQMIQEINTERASVVTNWLYKTITGKSLIPEPTLWEKIRNFIGF